MPEAEFRLGKDYRIILDLFQRKRGAGKERQKPRDGMAHVEAGRSPVPTRSTSSRPDTADSVPSAPDYPTHSRREMPHPPEIRNSPAAAAHGAPTGDPAASPASPKPRPVRAGRSSGILWSHPNAPSPRSAAHACP